jgi:hypothetical protein
MVQNCEVMVLYARRGTRAAAESECAADWTVAGLRVGSDVEVIGSHRTTRGGAETAGREWETVLCAGDVRSRVRVSRYEVTSNRARLLRPSPPQRHIRIHI